MEKAGRHCSGQQKLNGSHHRGGPAGSAPLALEVTGASLSSGADAAKISKNSGQTHPCCLTRCLESCVYFADNCRFA